MHVAELLITATSQMSSVLRQLFGSSSRFTMLGHCGRDQKPKFPRVVLRSLSVRKTSGKQGTATMTSWKSLLSLLASRVLRNLLRLVNDKCSISRAQQAIRSACVFPDA